VVAGGALGVWVENALATPHAACAAAPRAAPPLAANAASGGGATAAVLQAGFAPPDVTAVPSPASASGYASGALGAVAQRLAVSTNLLAAAAASAPGGESLWRLSPASGTTVARYDAVLALVGLTVPLAQLSAFTPAVPPASPRLRLLAEVWTGGLPSVPYAPSESAT
jgi:hypothetical protein